MHDLKRTILAEAERLQPELIAIRQHLHANPELSYKEYNTAAFISSYLERLGIPQKKGVAGTGIIGWIEGKGHGKLNIGLRAEMDALPVTENNDVSYKSRIPGVMHACGHDAHMAMLIGTAVILKNLQHLYGGTILLIFQPGEEKSPGGASLMIDSGELTNPAPDIVIAQHVLPELETGRVGYRAGRYMASADEIYITINGKGGHAALTDHYTDQIYIASEIIIKIKDDIKKGGEDRGIPTVLGIGKISGAGATNIIPPVVEIAGTFRTFDETWRGDAANIIREIASGIAAKYGVEINVNILKGYPVLVNDENLTEKAVNFSNQLLGETNVESFGLRMTSEDFSFFTEKYPALYYRVGIRAPGSQMRMLHTPEFDIDENALQTGCANLVWLALGFAGVND
jgi:amidohydrolase